MTINVHFISLNDRKNLHSYCFKLRLNDFTNFNINSLIPFKESKYSL